MSFLTSVMRVRWQNGLTCWLIKMPTNCTYRNDLVFITNGGCVEDSTYGSQTEPAPYKTDIAPGGGWDMWRRIAAQDASFGRPDKFCYDPEQTNWMSATVTTLDQRIVPYIIKICKRDPFLAVL